MSPQEAIQFTRDLSFEEAEACWRRVRQLRGGEVHLDCSLVVMWPSWRVVCVADLLRRLDRRKIAWSVNGVPPVVQKSLNHLLYERHREPRREARPAEELVNGTLSRTVRLMRSGAALYVLLQDAVYWTIVGPFMRHGFRLGRTLYEVTEIGIRALPIVALISAMMGLVLAMQAAALMRNYGATVLVANMVAMSIVRELGPLLAAVLMAGRSGSAIAAEIGSMVSSEEMDALRAMGVSITKYIVVPRFVALIIVVPCLAVFADVIGVGGGYTFSVLQLDIPSSEYINQTLKALTLRDLLNGLVKSEAYAIIIATVAVYQGMNATGGAEGIGRAATRSVVQSIIMIVVADLFFTALFYYAG